jgi:hypothetical protein
MSLQRIFMEMNAFCTTTDAQPQRFAGDGPRPQHGDDFGLGRQPRHQPDAHGQVVAMVKSAGTTRRPPPCTRRRPRVHSAPAQRPWLPWLIPLQRRRRGAVLHAVCGDDGEVGGARRERRIVAVHAPGPFSVLRWGGHVLCLGRLRAVRVGSGELRTS